MGGNYPSLFGVPIEFILFGLMLGGVALFHRRALWISLAGLLAILAFEALVTAFPTGRGATALFAHGEHEWVLLANLLLLLLGFEIVANQFERSNISDHMPNRLPDDWTGGAMLLSIIFVLAAFLDNIAAAMLGGVMARHVYKGRVSVGFLAAIVAVSNAGGAGSVIGDTTTTMMWLSGVSPLAVMTAFLGAGVALAIIAPLAARAQHKYQPILAHDEPDHPLEWRRILVVAIILVSAVVANVIANALSRWRGTCAMARPCAVGCDPLHQPDRETRLESPAAGVEGCAVPVLVGLCCIADAADDTARPVLADRVRRWAPCRRCLTIFRSLRLP